MSTHGVSAFAACAPLLVVVLCRVAAANPAPKPTPAPSGPYVNLSIGRSNFVVPGLDEDDGWSTTGTEIRARPGYRLGRRLSVELNLGVSFGHSNHRRGSFTDGLAAVKVGAPSGPYAAVGFGLGYTEITQDRGTDQGYIAPALSLGWIVGVWSGLVLGFDYTFQHSTYVSLDHRHTLSAVIGWQWL
jgi:hypothetical protein